ncbi:MAG TPA: hypothetical protein VGD00_07975 [Solirubrobacteraceae bacterium]|jgi:hypothetical protein
MAGKPIAGTGSAGGADRDAQDAAPAAAAERYGPLELRRMRKEDGRMLIVYEHREQTSSE